jgi:hypothetical protein
VFSLILCSTPSRQAELRNVRPLSAGLAGNAKRLIVPFRTRRWKGDGAATDAVLPHRAEDNAEWQQTG